jgi:hypothetical protein
MKHLKILGLAAVAAMASTALAASSASATTLEVGGVTQNSAVTFTMSMGTGTSTVLARTDGSLANTCSTSTAHVTTSIVTGGRVTGPLSSFTFESCTRPLTTHKPGKLYIEHEAGTTNGTVFSEETQVTMGTPFGTVNCQTGAGTDIGTLTGATTAQNPSAHAKLDVNAVTNCGFLLPSALWVGSYTVTSPTDLGVSA